jgi:hypothetical protein
VTSAVLHLDEEAPHIHFVTVPIAQVKTKNRHGERTTDKISFTALFSDTRKVIAQARWAGRTSEDTKLGRLQTSYAEAVAHLGLARGISSDRRHVTPKEYREAISKAAELPATRAIRREEVEVENPSLMQRLDILMRGKDSLALRAQQQAMLGMAKEAIQRSGATKVAHALTAENTMLKKTVAWHEQQSKGLTKNMVGMASEVAEAREKAVALRELAPEKLASLMGYTKEQVQATQVATRKWNAVNCVMAIEKMEYRSAVQALQVATGGSPAVAEMAGEYVKAREVEAMPKEEVVLKQAPMLSAMQKTQLAEATKQLEAIGAEQYSVTFMSKVKPTINLGKGKGPAGEEHFYSKEEILNTLIPTMGYHNARGYNIFITPMPTETVDYLLVDDIRNMAEVQKMQPAVILQSGPTKMQALVKMERVGMEHEQLNRWFRDTNKKIGDPKIAGIVHPMRLAGFTNRKPEYQKPNGRYPFVQVREAKGTPWEKAVEAARAVIDAWEGEARFQAQLAQVKATTIANTTARKEVRAEGQAMAYAIKYYEKATAGGYDLSASDFGLAKKLLEAGAKEEDVMATIAKHSPGLVERHPNTESYISNTIAKVREKVVAKEAEAEHEMG